MSNPKTWDTDDLRDMAWQMESKDDNEWPRYAKLSRKQALKIVQKGRG